MKKWFCLFLCAMLLLAALTPALAAELPKISFSVSTMSVHIGDNYRLIINSDRAFSSDAVITVLGNNGSRYEIPVKAGALTASVAITSENITEKTTIAYTFGASTAYKTAKPQQCKVTLFAYPRINFAQKEYITFVGSKYAVKATIRNSNGILNKTTLELRDQNGMVLATRDVQKGAGEVSFSVNLTDETYGRHDLVVYMDDKPLEGTAYFAVGRLKDPIVMGVDIPGEQKYLAMSLDCAYGDVQTVRLLDLLDSYDVNLTWFVTGQWAKAYPDHIRDFIARGHEVGNHSVGHGHMTQMGTHDKIDQILRTNNFVIEYCGVKPKLFRPPFDEYDKYIKGVCQAEGMYVTMWSIDSKDWDNTLSYEKVFERVTKSMNSGDIILMHNDGQHTYELIKNLVPYCRELGFEFVTISELIELGEVRVKTN